MSLSSSWFVSPVCNLAYLESMILHDEHLSVTDCGHRLVSHGMKPSSSVPVASSCRIVS